MIYLDTHVVVWLYAGYTERLPPGVCNLIETKDLFISPVVQLELKYLYEINRITKSSTPILEALHHAIGLKVCGLSFSQVIHQSMLQTWTKDPFDRIIVGQASVLGSILLTKDKSVSAHYPKSLWD